MKRLTSSFFALGATCLLLSGAHAAILASYEFTNVLTSSDTDPGSMAGSVSVGSAYSGNAYFDTLNPASSGGPETAFQPYYGVDADTGSATSDSAALAAGQYFQFTLTPVTGNVNLTSLTYDAVFNNGHPAVDAGWAVYSSLDNYTTAIDSFFLETDDALGGEGYFAQNVDLSGAAFQNLASPVTFRITSFDTSTSSSRQIGIDNLVLNGVPEPTSAALVIGSAGLLLLRRRGGSHPSHSTQPITHT